MEAAISDSLFSGLGACVHKGCSGGKGLAEGQIKFSLQNVRLGIVFYP